MIRSRFPHWALGLLTALAAVIRLAAQGVYFSDTISPRIATIRPNGTIATFSTAITDPKGLAFDALGQLYAVDYAGGSLYKVAADGSASVFVSGAFTHPYSLAIDASGTLAVSDAFHVYRVSPGGVVTTTPLPFNAGGSLAFDRLGNLYQSAGSQIRKLSADGTTISTFATTAPGISGLAIDSAGNLYVGATDHVEKYAPNGSDLGSYLGGLSGVFGAVAVATDPQDNLYAIAFGDSSIHEVQPNGHAAVIGSGFIAVAAIAVSPVAVPETGGSAAVVVLSLGITGHWIRRRSQKADGAQGAS